MTETETDIQSETLEALTYHPFVAWMRRYNSADVATTRGGKYRRIRCVRAAPGIEFVQLDLMGQLRDGRILAVEMKTPKSKKDKTYEEQCEEIRRIRANKGIAFMAISAEDALEQLDARLKI